MFETLLVVCSVWQFVTGLFHISLGYGLQRQKAAFAKVTAQMTAQALATMPNGKLDMN